MGLFNPVTVFPVTLTLALATPLVAPLAVQAAHLSFEGTVQLHNPVPALPSASIATPDPVAAAEVTITFHGHEVGIHEYTTERTAHVVTDSEGRFTTAIKLSDYRYRWTHVTLTVDATDISKATTITSIMHDDGQGGGQGSKIVQVTPL